jgi:hypothetical protein
MRRIRMKVREVDLTLMVYDFALVASSDMTSAYEADVDMSSYRSRYNEPKFKLDLGAHYSLQSDYFGLASLQKFVSEYLLTTGLYRRAFGNFFGSVAIIMDLNFSPEPEAEELIRFIKGSEHTKHSSQTEFGLSHADVPVLL